MTGLAPDALSIIDQCIYDYTRPLCLILDSNFKVKSWSGDCSYYGFDDIEVGKDCRDSMLFLDGSDIHNSFELRFVETPNEKAVHVHLFVDSERLTLVLIDATEQRLNHSIMQQKGNELALMQIEQLKLIENLKRLEREVEAKHRQAEQANQLKSRFIATMSHEFRTPLTSIMGYAMRLRPMANDPTQLNYLNNVEKGANHLLSLVENLLDHSQIDVGSLTINPIATDVTIVLDKLNSIFEPLAEDKQLSFRMTLKSELPDYLCLDEMRFRQILVNLISNAIKFTNEGSVFVETSWENEQLIVSVTDTGKGIAENDQQRIFLAFEQLGNEPGTGLGLSIVKHLISAMGGRLKMTSAIGEGSHFLINFPAKQVNADSDECQAERQNLQRKKSFLKTVLLVEDDPDIMHLLQDIFDTQNCRILFSDNGADGLKMALSEWPDLILLDLNLPDMTGFDVIKRLRDDRFTNPVFIQSAWASSEHKSKAMTAGCDEYLLKPLDIPHLTMLISDYFFHNHDPGMPLERYQQLYQRFLDSFPEKQNTLRLLHLNNNNFKWACSARQELHTFAHRLAGSADLYGMSSIARTSKQLDRLLIDYEDATAHQKQSVLQEKILDTVTKLSAQFDKVTSK